MRGGRTRGRRVQAHEREELLDRARQRGFVTLEEVMRDAGGTLDVDEVKEILESAGFELVEDEDEVEEETPAWEDAAEFGDEELETEAAPAALDEPDVVEVTAAPELITPDTPAAIYLRDISRVPLLTAAQEVQLAKALEAGELAKAELAKLAPDDPRRPALEQTVASGEQARRKLTEYKLRLVVSVARKYMGRGAPLLDLIQEGNIGL